MIRVQNLSKLFGAFTAVDGIAFEVAAGEIFAFLGPNEAGKTTTIKMLTTLLRASAGMIELDGLRLGEGATGSELRQARRRFGISRQLGSATSRAGTRCRQSKPAHKRPSPGPPAPCAGVAAGATQRKVASRTCRASNWS